MVQRDEHGKLIVRRRPGRKPLHGAAPSTMPPAHDPHSERGARAVERTEEGRGVRGREPVSSSPIREDERGPLHDWQCGKKLRGERAGLLCRNPKMKGAKTCRMHGSSTLRAREKAADLIIESTYPAVRKLREIINDPDAPYNAVIAACRDLLDRADLAGTTKVELEVPAFERTMARVVHMRRPGGAVEPRVIEGAIIEPVYPPLGPGEDPPAIEYKPGRPNVTDPLPAPTDDTPNGPGRAAHSLHEIVEGTGGAKAMLRGQRSKEGSQVRRANGTVMRNG